MKGNHIQSIFLKIK